MKKLLLYTFLAIFVMACQKKVTEIIPRDRISSDLAFSTPDKIETSVLGAYNSLQNLNFLSGRTLVYIDLMGNDVFDRGAYFGDLPRFNMLANSGFASSTWNAGYAAIATANRAAVGVAENETLLPAGKANELVGECLFVRAVAHFYMVNFFAHPYNYSAGATHEGIPVITENFTTNDPAANKPRSSVAEVYSSIIQDLTDAISLLPATYGTVYETKTRATKAAAASLLARVQLYKGDFAVAESICMDIMNGVYGSFDLQSSPAGVFGPGNYQTTETIWSIPNNPNDNPNTNNALPMHYHPNGRADIAVAATFLDAATNPYLPMDDLRRTDMLISGNISDGTQHLLFTGKYPDVGGRADWAPVLRYAEILLIYAECAARTGTGVDVDALNALNQVRNRAQVSEPSYTAASFTDKDDFIAAIMGERRIELAFEGHRFWDMMRTNTAVTDKYDNDGVSLLPVLNPGTDKAIFPIPQAEIDKSGGVLKQNNSY